MIAASTAITAAPIKTKVIMLCSPAEIGGGAATTVVGREFTHQIRKPSTMRKIVRRVIPL